MSVFLRKLIANYRKSCRIRGIEWALDERAAIVTFYAPCYYCGRSPSRFLKSSAGHVSPKPVSGIDRLDSGRGYVPSNTVACCSQCNYAKGEMNFGEFSALVSKIHAHLNLSSLDLDCADCFQYKTT